MAFNLNCELAGPYASAAPNATGSSSFSFSIPAAGLYMIDYKISMPRLSQGGAASGVIVTITNATGPVTVFSGLAGADGGRIDFLAALNDVITFNLSSVTAADFSSINLIKAQIAISSGV